MRHLRRRNALTWASVSKVDAKSATTLQPAEGAYRVNPRKSDGRYAYERIITELREMITPLPSGARVPVTLEELAKRHSVVAQTARRALTELEHEGLIVVRHGSGIYVRKRPPARRVASNRYQAEIDQVRERGGAQLPPETSFTRDQGITWDQYRLDKDFREIPAPDDVATLLGVEPGTPLLARHFVFHANDEPQQISDSYYPLALVQGTPVADPANEPWPGGNIAQLATLGIYVTRVEESVRARMPTPDETHVLRIPPGVPVLTITRRMFVGEKRDTPVEAAVDIVIPGDRVVLDYAIDLSIKQP